MPKTVADVMTRDPVVVTPTTPLKDAIKILAERRISGVPVVDGSGNLVGILSETDLMWREKGITPPPYIMLLDSIIYLENPTTYEKELHKALGESVGDVMSDRPISTTPDTPLKEAAKLLYEHQIRRLPVLDPAGKVIGILTRGDIVREMAASQDS